MAASADALVPDAPVRLPGEVRPVAVVQASSIQVDLQHDMAGLAVSNIVPLPHQLEAVYSAFLNQSRLWFPLADGEISGSVHGEETRKQAA